MYGFFLVFQFVITFTMIEVLIRNYLLNFYHIRMLKFVLEITFIIQLLSWDLN
jgi:hypothetical protein